MVYIASDKPLPLIGWSEDKPAFCVSDLTKYEKAVESQFKFSHVYNAGSHQGCGCGFFKDFKEGDELARAHDNYIQLNAYLQKAREMGANNQIFSCWDGDQDARPEFREQIGLNHLVDSNFEFKEKALYEILPDK